MFIILFIILILSLILKYLRTTQPFPFSISPPSNFIMRDRRDMKNSNNGYYKYVDSRIESSLPCMNKIDWSVPYTPGYNNTYSDLLWHEISPRNIVYNNDMDCNINGLVSPQPFE